MRFRTRMRSRRHAVKEMKIVVGILIILTTLAFWLILFKGGGAGYG